MAKTNANMPMSTVFIGRSRSVRGVSPLAPLVAFLPAALPPVALARGAKSRSPSLRPRQMVGSD